MCVQCAMGAVTAGAAATGMKAWVEAYVPSAVNTPAAKRVLRFSAYGIWVLAAGLLGAGAS